MEVRDHATCGGVVAYNLSRGLPLSLDLMSKESESANVRKNKRMKWHDKTRNPFMIVGESNSLVAWLFYFSSISGVN